MLRRRQNQRREALLDAVLEIPNEVVLRACVLRLSLASKLEALERAAEDAIAVGRPDTTRAWREELEGRPLLLTRKPSVRDMCGGHRPTIPNRKPSDRQLSVKRQLTDDDRDGRPSLPSRQHGRPVIPCRQPSARDVGAH